jgi:hypothetical protein
MFEIGSGIGHGRIVRRRSCPFQHFLRDVETKHRGRARFARPSAEPAVATANIDHVQAAHLRQHGAQRGPFGGAGETLFRTAQLAIVVEKFGVVVNVLCHL